MSDEEALQMSGPWIFALRMVKLTEATWGRGGMTRIVADFNTRPRRGC